MSPVELKRLLFLRTAELSAANKRLQAEIEKREQAEASLRHAQKIETIGQLTAGVAHDFNNLLMVIIGNIERVQRGLGNDASWLPETARQALDNAMGGAQCAATLTQRLLAFSRRHALAPQPVEINRLIAGMTGLLRCALGETVELRSVLEDALWRVEVEPNQLEAAILNLTVNARDAMPAGGRLTIATHNTRFDECPLGMVPNEYVMICITDTGTGLAEEVLARVGEPFFTTKKVGEGTGLGLAQVNDFVKLSNGYLKIYTELGSGTSVELYLPRSGGHGEAVQSEAIDPAPVENRWHGVLLAHDADNVRPRSEPIPREFGCLVPEAAEGDVAWRRSGHPMVRSTSRQARNAIAQSRETDRHDCTEIKRRTFAYSAPANHVHASPRANGPKWVLVVEDEARLRMLMVQYLREQGYEVAEAGSAAEALKRVRDAESLFDAAIVDMCLPDRPGDALIVDLRVQLPELPILIVSGYVEAALGKLPGSGGLASLAKPYDLGSLQVALEMLLTHSVPTAPASKSDCCLLSQQGLEAVLNRPDRQKPLVLPYEGSRHRTGRIAR